MRCLAVGVALVLALPANGQDSAGAAAAASPSAPPVVVPAGTIIDLVTVNAISSKKSVKGDLLHLKVASPLIVDGMTVIAVDTVVVGQLARAEQRGAFGRSGKLEAHLLYAELPGGTVRISGAIEARGKGGADDAAATAAAFLALPFVATGRSAEIPAGSAVSGRLSHDLRIDRP